jgi:hypothetical protein
LHLDRPKHRSMGRCLLVCSDRQCEEVKPRRQLTRHNRGRRHDHTRNGKASAEYKSWAHMKSRCYCPRNNRFPNYGGRGIAVCGRWCNSSRRFLLTWGRSRQGNIRLSGSITMETMSPATASGELGGSRPIIGDLGYRTVTIPQPGVVRSFVADFS